MNKKEFLKGRIPVPRPLVADAYTVAGEVLLSNKGKQKSVYNFTNRYSPARAFSDVARDSRMVFYGLTEYVREHLTKPVTKEEVDLSVEFMSTAHSFGGPLKFDPKPWYRVVDEFGGYMPIKIEALPEGSTFFPNEPVVQVTSLGEGFGEMAAHVEAVLLGMVSIASARVTLERHWFERIKEWCIEDKNLPVAQYMIHDFGMRASSCAEESELLGKAHLLVFHGTDTFNAAYQARKMGAHPQTGTSILALAHRIVQSYKDEIDAYTNLLKQDKIGSYVADCYNYKKAVSSILGRLASEFPDKTIVARPDCYDDKTEILTEYGWKLFKNLPLHYKVAQYHDDGSIEFVKYTNYIEQDYSGDMVFFSGEKSGPNLLVTPNHRCVYQKNNKFYIQKAEEIKLFFGKRWLTAGLGTGKETKLSNEDRLRIAFQADGSYESRNSSGDFQKRSELQVLRFNFSKQRKIDRLIKICKDGKFNYSAHQEKGRIGQKTIYVRVPFKVEKTFEWVIKNIYNYNYLWCQEFIEEVSNWDASVRRKGRIKYDSTIPINSEAVQLVATLGNYRTKYTVYKDNRKECFSDVHTIHILDKNWIGGQSISKEIKNYNGKIYCISVPTGMLLVRRNNCISISGNSGDYLENDLFVQREALENGLVEKLDNGVNCKYGPKNLTSINGDSMTPRKIESVFRQRTTNGFSPTRWGIFGVGGYLRNNVSRDSLSSAYKLSSIGLDNEPVIKLSDSLGKMSVPGPVNLRRYPDCDDRIRIKETVFLESEYNTFGEPAYVTFYDGSKDKIEDKFGDVVTEDFSKIQDRTIENFDRYSNVMKSYPDFGLPSCSCLSRTIIDMQQKMLKKYR